MNNEPAFPSGSMGPDGLHISESIYEGLTIRDYFAAKAMQGLIENGSTIPKEIAQASYILADAMMKAREVNHEAA